MTTDREMMEAAARAAGIEFDPERSTADALFTGLGSSGALWWRPQDDDGQALRLAVKLRMKMQVTDDYASAEPEELVPRHFAEPINGDASQALRRAIVRAAASMGEAK